ncbi:type II toxin-antitoxin system CcdA family antitoxin [Azospirillum brasilense]|uniref:type II toxin-antitoxin system CcdA family antitoxin n=1 Tax=Azospirillum brasilense TaxID=192 RepID=UPI00119E7EFB|nr:type II toxin-antitoxin system CcdA family antitoxin [Azospirillum brasilense]
MRTEEGVSSARASQTGADVVALAPWDLTDGQQRWVEENRPALNAYDVFVAKHGVFSEGKRLF